MINRIYTFEEDLAKRMKNPKFKAEWEKSETEYQLAKEIIKKRLSKNISQRALAKKLKTSQAAVSRIETMSGNPSLSFLKRIATALNSRLVVKLE
jgi:ribosome-binding protein aMBF1 (putative translation factor)